MPQVGLALLWWCQVMLQAPTLASWSVSPGSLVSDPSLIHCVCLLASASLLWQQDTEVTTIEARFRDGMFYSLHALAAIIIPFATISGDVIGGIFFENPFEFQCTE